MQSSTSASREKPKACDRRAIVRTRGSARNRAMRVPEAATLSRKAPHYVSDGRPGNRCKPANLNRPAEGEGFEPSDDLAAANGLRDGLRRPLRQKTITPDVKRARCGCRFQRESGSPGDWMAAATTPLADGGAVADW